jgi:hypothetical protein
MEDGTGEVVRVYRGAEKHVLHDRMFFSTNRYEAESYGAVLVYDLPTGRLFDSLDRDTIEPLLPLWDPWDDTEIETFEQYLKHQSDTWSIIEDILGDLSGYDVLKITEGGVENYLVMKADWVPDAIPQEPAPPSMLRRTAP